MSIPLNPYFLAKFIRETAGPTNLAVAAINTLELLRRNGANVEGISLSSLMPLLDPYIDVTNLAGRLEPYIDVTNLRGYNLADVTNFLRHDGTWSTPPGGGGSVIGGDGLLLTGSTLDVRPGDGIEISSDLVRVKLDGSTLSRSSSGMKVTNPYFVINGAECYRSTDQSISSATRTKISFDTVICEDDVTFAAGVDPLTIHTTGKYQINWHIYWDPGASAYCDCELVYNGSVIGDIKTGNLLGYNSAPGGCIEAILNPGDTLGLSCYQSSGGPVNVTVSVIAPFISVRRIA